MCLSAHKERKMIKVKPNNIDEYIALFTPEIGGILLAIRQSINEIIPLVEESISYQMPCFRHGKNYIYIGAFKGHIGIYPPIKDETDLFQKLRPFMNEKGNLAFPYKNGIPYDLIDEIIRFKLK